MRVQVTDHQSDRTKLYEGTQELIEHQVMFDYPFLRFPADDRGDLQALLEHLDATAAYQVDVDDEPLQKSEFDRIVPKDHPALRGQLGFEATVLPAFRAARFLAGGQDLPDGVARSALLAADGDVEAAALAAYHMEPSAENLASLRAVAQVADFDKAEPGASTAQSVEAVHMEGQDVAEAVRRAFVDSFVFPVQLGGKHSAGSMLAYDKQTGSTWLLKSGVGGAGGAAGAKQDPSAPNAREAAWYHLAKEWGVWGSFPRAELLLIDGRQFAALKFLGGSYETLDHRRKADPGAPARVLRPYLYDGVLHQWAVMDYVLGQTDRHGQNVMVDDSDDVKLIDEGSAFAGPAFDPANDKNSFVPYYLRAWALGQPFTKLPVEDKLRSLPRVPETVAKRLHGWVSDLSSGVLEAYCYKYGIDPVASSERLARVKNAITEAPVDLAINRLWVTT